MQVHRVLGRLEPGGAQLSLLRIAAALSSRGVETRILAGNATPQGIALARRFGFDPDVMDGPGDLQWQCDDAFAQWLSPRLADARIVHAHMAGAWWAAARALPEGPALVASEHNAYTWPGRPAWDALATIADRVDLFFAHGPGARAGALRVGIPPERIRDGISPVVGLDAIPRPDLPAPRITFTGRLAPDKAPDVLIEALARMPRRPPAYLLGDGPMSATLRARVEELGLDDVHLVGWIDDPAPWVAGSAVQVCPSRDESFSQSAVLAMGLGVPVIGTRVDGFPATLAEGRGILVAPDDPRALAEAITDVLAGRARTDVAGARRWARRFALDNVADRYLQAYRDVIARRELVA